MVGWPEATAWSVNQRVLAAATESLSEANFLRVWKTQLIFLWSSTPLASFLKCHIFVVQLSVCPLISLKICRFAYVKTKDKYLCLVNLLFIYFFPEAKYQSHLKTDLQACAGKKKFEYYSVMHLCAFGG